MAGNSVILKAPPQASLSTLDLGRMAQDIFPPGVFNVVSVPVSVASDHLVSDPRIRRIAFTESDETAREISRVAANHLAVVSLELGGKNPSIVFPDADLEVAAGGAVQAMNFAWQGQ